MSNLSKPLTPQQQAIVDHNHGPALVFAVAGAGKTTAMVRRIERLCREQVFMPDHILATSFSRATVQDIRAALTPWSYCANVRLLTLHALGYRMIRQAHTHGYAQQARLDSSDSGDLSHHLLYQALALARSRKVAYRHELETLDQEDFLSFIGACKGNLRYAALDQAHLPDSTEAHVATQAVAPTGFDWYLDLYRLFEEVRQEQTVITFDDMLMAGWELLVRHPDLLQRARSQYACVLVDEFQDVNLAQSEILDLISAPHRDYMAIGDDDQTIYEWRGADPRFILGFQQRYQAQVYLIDDNFRCKASQVVLANQVIRHNQKRRPKRLGLTRGFAGDTFVYFEDNLEQQGRNLVGEIQAALGNGMAHCDIAVLVRIYAQTPYIEHFLIAAQIPYQIIGGEPFYRRPEVLTLFHYLRLGLLERDLLAKQTLSPEQIEIFDAAWRNIYNRPKRYLSHIWSEQVRTLVLGGMTISQAIRSQAGMVERESTCTAIAALAEHLDWLAAVVDTLPAEQVLAELDTRLDYSAFLRKSSGFAETGVGRVANVTAIIDYARGKGIAAAFLQHLEQIDGSRYGDATTDQYEKVTLTTIFRSKGLEWPVVFIPQCNEGTYPFGEPERIEEERRLLYVAITRSQRYLHIHCLKHLPISPFLREAAFRQTLEAVAALQSTLVRDPTTWGKQDALTLLRYPPRYGLERYFSHWWPVSPETRRRAIQAIQKLLHPDRKIEPGSTHDLADLWQEG